MKQNLQEFFPQPHPTKLIFARHHIPVAAVARFLNLSTDYVSNLLIGFANISPGNDTKLREFALLVEGDAMEAKMNLTSCFAQTPCSTERKCCPWIKCSIFDREVTFSGQGVMR